MVNEAIRFSLEHDARSRKTMQPCHAQLRQDHPNTSSFYAANARDDALKCLKVYRRRQRKGLVTKTPYRHKLVLPINSQYLRLDIENAMLMLPLQPGKYITFKNVPFSDWHRSILSNPEWKLGAATITPTKIILTVKKETPVPYEPEGAIALDTNETSLDGVQAQGNEAQLVQISFPDVRIVQATHFRRRRKLTKKKAHDARVKRRLLAKEGRREKNRVKQRLHIISKNLVRYAQENRLAIVLEDLHTPGGHTRSHRMNRRLSSWPRGELHRQIAYKAEAQGVPLVKINPRNTSKTCPVCDAIDKKRRGRTGKGMFVCPAKCGWSLDRQFNAGCNILQTAIRVDDRIARAVRFQPAALPKDVMKPLCKPEMAVRAERKGRELAVLVRGE